MAKKRFVTVVFMSLLLVFVCGCNKGRIETERAATDTPEKAQVEKVGDSEQREQVGKGKREEHAREGQGEHGGEGGESGEGEEAGPGLAKGGTHDEVREGVRLILSFDKLSSSFIGTVENVTEKTVPKVRVEVHLSNGTELGPTESIDLASGKKVKVKLSAEGQSFKWWKAHAEAGVSEH